MKNIISKILTLSIVVLFSLTSCQEEHTKVVQQKHPTGGDKYVLYYEGEQAKENFVRAELYYENGQVMTIKRYEKGVQNGYTESFYDDGSEMAKVMYKDGEKFGYYYKKHQNGQIAYTGYYKLNKRNGDWIKMDENGDTIRIETYEIGKLLGSKKFKKD